MRLLPDFGAVKTPMFLKLPRVVVIVGFHKRFSFKRVIAITIALIFNLFFIPNYSYAAPKNVKLMAKPVTRIKIGEPAQFMIGLKFRDDAKRQVYMACDSGLLTGVGRISNSAFVSMLFLSKVNENDRVYLMIKEKTAQGVSTSKLSFLPGEFKSPESTPLIQIKAEPPAIILNQDNESTIKIKLTDPDGKPIDDASLKIKATVGEIGKIASHGEGLYSATFKPPTSKSPAVAIITIEESKSKTVAFETIELVGSDEYPVETAPFGKITIKVGDQTFGPVQANGRGFAKIKLEVPPGANIAELLETFPDKKTRVSNVDLGVPQIKKVFTYINPSRLQADGKSEAEIHLYLIRQGGGLLQDIKDIEASAGSLSELTEIGHNHYKTTLTAPESIGNQRALVILPKEVKLRDGRVKRIKKPVELIKLYPGQPTKLEIIESPKRVLAEEKKIYTVKYRLADDSGRGIPYMLPKYHFKGGDIVGFKDLRNGEYVVGIRPKKGMQENLLSTFEVAMAFPDGENLNAATDIPLAIKKPEAVVFHEQPEIVSNRNIITLKFAVTDVDGRYIIGEKLNAKTNSGKIIDVVESETEPGIYYVKYQASKDTQGMVNITLSELDGEYTSTLSFDVDIREVFLGFSLWGGYFSNFDTRQNLLADMMFEMAFSHIAENRLGFLFSSGVYAQFNSFNSSAAGVSASPESLLFNPLSFGFIGYLPTRKVDVDLGLTAGIYLIDTDLNSDIAEVDIDQRFAGAVGGNLFIRVGGPIGMGKMYLLGKFTYVNSTPLTPGGDLGPAATGATIQLGYKFGARFFQ